MKIAITHRLFIAILFAALLSVLGMFFVMQWNIDRAFLRYLDSQEQKRIVRLAGLLEQTYAMRGSFDSLRLDNTEWRKLLVDSLPEEETWTTQKGLDSLRSAKRLPETSAVPWRFGQHVFLLDQGRQLILGSEPTTADIRLQPVRYHDKVVAYLGLLPRSQLSDFRQVLFVRQQKVGIALVAVLVFLVATALSLPLATRLVRPIRSLARATRDLVAGNYTIRVPVRSSDELGQLAENFNALAQTLESNQQSRRQWIADTSHELRTPLAILRGEIEALQDGIRQPMPEFFNSLHAEVLRLSRLVDDLYQLSLSDLGALTYRKDSVDLCTLLSEALALYRMEIAAKGIVLIEEMSPGKGLVLFGDYGRLFQLFSNILDNSVKYTNAGGAIRVAVEYQHGNALIDFYDSEPGVHDHDLDHLFERLYRVETSRNRTTGGAGLGLSLCKAIVDAHGGTIEAHPSSLGGVRIHVTLPLLEGG